MTPHARTDSKRSKGRKPTRGRPPKGASVLSRSNIVQAALEVIDAEGLDAVSLRSVARRLSVDATSLYNHIESKDDLLDAVTDHILATFDVPARTGVFADDLRNVARAFRTHAIRHPNATLLVLTRPTMSVGSLAPLEAILALLVGVGCSPEQAVHLLRLMMAMMVGSVLRDATLAVTLGGDASRFVARYRAAFETSGFAHVVAATPYLLSFDSEAEFEFSLQVAITAIVSQLPCTPKPSVTRKPSRTRAEERP